MIDADGHASWIRALVPRLVVRLLVVVLLLEAASCIARADLVGVVVTLVAGTAISAAWTP